MDNHRVDNLLGVPEKINIPERYVPEEQVRSDAGDIEDPSIDVTSEHFRGCMLGNKYGTCTGGRAIPRGAPNPFEKGRFDPSDARRVPGQPTHTKWVAK